MAARKAETEKPGSYVPKARAKSAVVGTELQLKADSSDPTPQSNHPTNCLFNVHHYQPEYEQK